MFISGEYRKPVPFQQLPPVGGWTPTPHVCWQPIIYIVSERPQSSLQITFCFDLRVLQRSVGFLEAPIHSQAWIPSSYLYMCIYVITYVYIYIPFLSPCTPILSQLQSQHDCQISERIQSVHPHDPPILVAEKNIHNPNMFDDWLHIRWLNHHEWPR